MFKTHARFAIPLSLLGCLPALPAAALLPAVYTFSTGSPDGSMATASRPESTGKFEIETGDDFTLTTTTSINSATFTGLLTGDGSVSNVRVEIYRVFPFDSVPPVGQRADAGQFALRQRICGTGRCDGRAELCDQAGGPQLHRRQLGAAGGHPSITGPNHRRQWSSDRRGSRVRCELHSWFAPPRRSLLLRASGRG